MTDFASMEVLKVELAGSVTSFRYPHFTQGFQPTYLMPPPSTIYGLLCSAVGDYIDPVGLVFGYHFTHDGLFVDYKEHLHFSDPVQPNPYDRELLFNPRLTLYLSRLDLEPAFWRPRYTLTFGRSQDLVTVSTVSMIQLRDAEAGFFTQTLLSLAVSPLLDANTTAVTMPRFIDRRRRTAWGQYAILQNMTPYPSRGSVSNVDWAEEEAENLVLGDNPLQLWVDESCTHPKDSNLHRIVWFHSFVDG